jgi:hypothetical protein
LRLKKQRSNFTKMLMRSILIDLMPNSISSHVT